MPEDQAAPYVSRAGAKLAHALDHFDIDPTGRICADLGSNVGGFVDCLLQRGARKVYSVDTSRGTLAWTLRNDPRVVVMERTNALHLVLDEPVQLVTVDVGWTRQHVVLPRALDLLDKGGIIISLIKPHYESPRDALCNGVLPDDAVSSTVMTVTDRLCELGIEIVATTVSPLRGDAGNREVLALVRAT